MKSKTPDRDFALLQAVKTSLKTSLELWHWLCEEHPQIALEYQAIIERN